MTLRNPNADELVAALRKGVHHERHGLTDIAADRIKHAVFYLTTMIEASEAMGLRASSAKHVLAILNGQPEPERFGRPSTDAKETKGAGQ